MASKESGKVKLRDPPASYRSSVWKHFGFREKESTAATCKLCFVDIPYRHGNTSNLNTHLTRHHGIGISQSLTKSCSTSTKANDLNKSPKPVASASQSTIKQALFKQLPHSSTKSKSVTQAIGVFIACDMRPYSVVDNAGFRNLLNTLEPRYAIPSRTHMAETVIPALYNKVKTRLESELKKATCIAITTDSWTSRATENYIAVTAHFIDVEDWKVHTYTLETKMFSESHTGENLADALIKTVAEWDLERDGNGPAVCTDNAANIVKAVKIAGFSPHIPCFAHTLNLATSRGLSVRELERLLGRVRKIVAYFHRSTSATALLKEKQKLLGLKQNKLIMDVCTRWNSSYDMIVRYLEQQAAVFATLVSKELKKNIKDIVTLSDEDNKNLESVVSVLAPLKMATTTMCTRNSTVSLIHPLKERLLQELKLQADDNGLIKAVKLAIMNDLLPRYCDDDLNAVLVQSSAMDPRFKSLPYVSDEEKENVFLAIEKLAAPLVPVQIKKENDENVAVHVSEAEESSDKETVSKTEDSAEVVSSPAKIQRTESDANSGVLGSLFGDVFITDVQPAKSDGEKIQSEVSNYRAAPCAHIMSNPLEWWKDRVGTYSILSKLAIKMLTIPATSVESERVFSTAGDIVCHQRASLSSENVDKLVFLKKNLIIPNDLQ